MLEVVIYIVLIIEFAGDVTLCLLVPYGGRFPPLHLTVALCVKCW